MKKEVILVPKDKCPLDVLAEMGERTRNAWIFLNKNLFPSLVNSNCSSCKQIRRHYVLTWEATSEYPKTEVIIDDSEDATWRSIINIFADDIAFKAKPDDPEDIFFLKREE